MSVSFRHRFFKVLMILLAVGVLFVAVAAAHWFSIKPVYVLPETKFGQHLEDFLPPEANVIALINRSDPQLNQLIKKSTGKTVDELMTLLADMLIKEEELPREIAMKFVKAEHIALGGIYDATQWSSESASNKDEDTRAPFSLTVAFAIDDPAGVNEALAQRLARQRGQANNNSKLAAEVVKNVLVISTTSSEILHTQLTTPQWKHKHLGYKKHFQSLVQKLPAERFATFYIDELNEGELAEKSAQGDFISGRMVVALSTNAEGIKMDSYSVATSPIGAHAKLLALNSISHEEILKQVPTNGLFAATESFNIAESLALQPSFTKIFDQILSLNYKRDLEPILKKAAAFVMADAGTLLPAVSLYAQLDKPEDAAPFLAKMDEVVGNLVIFGNFMVKTDQAKGPFIERAPITGKGIAASSVTAHVDRASPDVTVSPFITSLAKTARLTYGTVEQNGTHLVFVSSLPTIIQDLRNSALLGRGTELLNRYTAQESLKGQRAFIDLDAFGVFAERTLGELAELLPENERPGLTAIGQNIQKILSPFDALFIVSGADAEHLISRGLLRL